jgi:hypothetical protein
VIHPQEWCNDCQVCGTGKLLSLLTSLGLLGLVAG